MLLLLDRFRFTEDVLGGGVGAGELIGVFFLIFLGTTASSLFTLAFDEAAELLMLSCRIGSLGILMRVLVGIGTVCDLLLFRAGPEGYTSEGDVDDHDVGVVVVVEALHGLGDVVNCVEGLLIVLIVLIAGVGLR